MAMSVGTAPDGATTRSWPCCYREHRSAAGPLKALSFTRETPQQPAGTSNAETRFSIILRIHKIHSLTAWVLEGGLASSSQPPAGRQTTAAAPVSEKYYVAFAGIYLSISFWWNFCWRGSGIVDSGTVLPSLRDKCITSSRC